MKKLDALFSKNAGKRSFNLRYTKEQRANYEKDLFYVVKGVLAGRCRPMLKDLQAYFFDTYGMTMTDTTLRKHLRILESGQKLWPGK